MKKSIIMLAAAVLFYTALHAQQNTPAEKVISLISFDRLVVDGNMTVLLQESNEFSIKVSGSTAFVNSFSIRQRNDKMTMTSDPEISNTAGNVVIVNIKNLKSIVVSGEASILSNNVLTSPKLDILLDAIASVNISSTGKVNVRSTSSYMPTL